METIVAKIAPYILGDNSEYTLQFYSDSTGLYLGILVIFLISILLSSIWHFWEEKNQQLAEVAHRWFPMLTICICYYLSLQMSIYGFSKLFKYQFYDAHPNTLYTPVGFLTKDFLYWTSIGSSQLYNTVTGSLEVLIAVLLWFTRTRAFASVIGLLISSYLVLINFAFDINVKIQSMFFLLLFLMISFPTLKRLYLFFFKQKVVKLDQPRKSFFSNKRFRIGVKVLIISLILVESLYPYVRNQNFNGDALTKPPFYGAYKIENDYRYKRFFIHSDPYFIIQDHNDKLYSFPMTIESDAIILNHNTSVSRLTMKVNDSIISLQGDFFGSILDIDAKKLNIEYMPLYQDSFQWTIDGYQKEE